MSKRRQVELGVEAELGQLRDTHIVWRTCSIISGMVMTVVLSGAGEDWTLRGEPKDTPGTSVTSL